MAKKLNVVSPDVGKDTQFTSTNQPENRGRKLNLRNELKKLLEGDGVLKIEAKNIDKIFENGDVNIKVPRSEQLMIKLLQLAMGGKSSQNIRAIITVMEQLEGKPTQRVEFAEYENKPTVFIDATSYDLLSDGGYGLDGNPTVSE